jgi:hypothetical protein
LAGGDEACEDQSENKKPLHGIILSLS